MPETEQRHALAGTRIPTLDGLRAVAILLVIKSHLTGGFYSIPWLGTGRFPLRFTLGYLGVRIFFVISGFLITTLLLVESEKTGRISLKGFYFRRALRILPASYFLLLCLGVATAVGILAIPKISFLASILYFRNYLGSDWYTGHLWSLSVEEQFYLLWPAVLVLMGKRGALIACCCTLPVAALLRTFRPENGFETNMDALACGCILAGLWGVLGRSEGWQRFLRSKIFWVVPVAVLASNKLEYLGGVWLAVGIGVVNVLIAVSIERLVRYHDGIAGKLLNTRAAVLIGTLSYSLYLWQQPWIVSMSGHGVFQTFPLNLALALACAWISYKFIEQPFLNLRARWGAKRSTAVLRPTESAL